MSKALHLNLLRQNEIVSSSPIRFRILLPVLAVLACVGMVAWWLTLVGGVMMAESKKNDIEQAIAAHDKAFAEATRQKKLVQELKSQLEQLDGYRAGRRTWGKTLTAFAEVIPLKVQLTKLEIPPPPPQNLQPPKGKKGPPLWGPTNSVESVKFVFSGRTPKYEPVNALMDSLAGEAFNDSLIIDRTSGSSQQSPRVRSFRQDAAAKGKNALTFEIEYRAVERRFAQ